ncbi:hypothetical protein CR159_19345 [Pollutimonas subterranea]|uniref:Exopolysaccharide synthesis, ExoD n=1 Tax=Pollutimonas subterranea TaxID=2045210 RepID=A0A2N4TZN6_9BURK|nr:exopolysaccharide biosynthesis protein [Pollutimonas subterranea]PLC48230.1 hypothetical protein CR159_19345 [Pollutimonas subterranea]
MNKPHKRKEAGHDNPLEHVIDSIVELGKKQEAVSVADIQENVGQRSFGPFLFIPAIFEMSPLGAVPGVPTLLGLIVFMTAGQMLFGRRHFWLPGFISKRSIKGERIGPAMQKIRPVVQLIDKGLRPRLQRITKKPWNRAMAGVCVLCALTVPPLEVVPFGSSGPFAAIALIGLGLMGHDGAFVWLGVITAAVAFYLLSFTLF